MQRYILALRLVPYVNFCLADVWTRMRTSSAFEQEKQELESLLASGIFDRAPNLALLLKYVCSKHFDGSADQIKEYNIAVEALGRPPEFDQKRDSIVRVEAHRLRKRLREFYASEGASHAVRLEIQPGSYMPRFVSSEVALGELPANLMPENGSSGNGENGSRQNGGATGIANVDARAGGEVPAAEPVLPAQLAVAAEPQTHAMKSGTGSGRRWVVIGVLGLIAVAAALASWWKSPVGTMKDIVGRPAETPVGPPSGTVEIRLLAGNLNGTYTDHAGNVWQSDRFFNGGAVFDSASHPVFGTRDLPVFRTRREGSFTYDIPLPAGVYELRLFFAETLYGENNAGGGGETTRLFNVFINGKRVLNQFDVIEDAGTNQADIRAFKDVTPAADGKLHLRFESYSNVAFLNAMEITPGTAGHFRPIRMVARDRTYTDKEGHVWEPDVYAKGGQLIARQDAVAGASDVEIYRGERFGNMTYTVPVADGKYGITLYFSEGWFGPGKPPGGGVGSRLFDILCNGVALRRNFDIFKEAHGSNRAVKLTFHGLTPNGQGKLAISLAPVRNYACVNALEIVDEGK